MPRFIPQLLICLSNSTSDKSRRASARKLHYSPIRFSFLLIRLTIAGNGIASGTACAKLNMAKVVQFVLLQSGARQRDKSGFWIPYYNKNFSRGSFLLCHCLTVSSIFTLALILSHFFTVPTVKTLNINRGPRWPTFPERKSNVPSIAYQSSACPEDCQLC